ncbi:cysteine-rich receptor-like protein kinase 8 [Tanacetum coccineum]
MRKFTKSLYGLKQSNRQWFKKLTTFLISIGFKQRYVDTSLFSLNKDGKFTTLLVYVDDILIADNDKKSIQEIKANLNEKFNIKDLGLLHSKPSAIPLDPLLKLTMTGGELLTKPSLYRTLLSSRRSVTGYGVLLRSSLISWQSKKQLVISRSSTEAGYRALTNTTCEVTWLKCLLKEFQVLITTPIPIMCDNTSSIALASNPVHHARTKHIEIDCIL